MNQDTFHQSLLKTARVAGITCLLSIIIVVYANFGILNKLVTDDPSATAGNILAHENLFRFSIVCHLMYCAGIVTLSAAFYIILRQVNRGLALTAMLFRLIHALVWIPIVLNFFTALRLSRGATYLHAFAPDQLQSLARLSLSGNDTYYVGLLFWSMASTICSYLWLKSKYIPSLFAIFGLISSIWCTACTFIYIIFPGFSDTVNLWWFDSPMTIFEIVISFWLLIKGI